LLDVFYQNINKTIVSLSSIYNPEEDFYTKIGFKRNIKKDLNLRIFKFEDFESLIK
jgi:hypothetical protein